MNDFLKTCREHFFGSVAGLMLLTLLFTLSLLSPENRTALAQEPGSAAEFEQVTFASTDGASTIVSQQAIFEADAFIRSGQLEQLQLTPTGLTLNDGATSGTYLSDPLRSPLEFTTDIGPAWLAEIPEGATVSVEARLSRDGQSWADWSPVPVEYYPIRDGEYGGSLIWVDEAETYIQFRLTMQASPEGSSPRFRRLSLYFNDTSRGPTAQAAMAAVHSQEADAPATSCPAKPQVIPRVEWGCPPGSTSPKWPPVYKPVTHIVINHTATPNEADDWARVVRSIWHYHAHILGWGDVGYQYLIDPLGNIYEGRAGGDDVIGAFDGFNRGAMGIGYIGCYGNCETIGLPNTDPSPAMLEAGNELIAWKIGQKGLDPFGEGPYCEQTLPTIVGRSEVMCRGGSLSPGDFLEEIIPDMRGAVEETLAACPVNADPPFVEWVTPNAGLISEEVLLLVQGEKFRPNEAGFKVTLTSSESGASFDLALSDVPPTSASFEAIVPANLLTSGFYDLTVMNPDGQSGTLVDAYEALADAIPPPKIVDVTPNEGSISEEVILTITGQNFEPDDVAFKVELRSSGGTETQPLVIGETKTSTNFEAVVPANQLQAGLYDLIVTNPDGQSDDKPNAYEAVGEVGTAVVRVAPASLQIGVDGTGVTAVEAADISGLFGVDIELTYDPEVVEVVDADPETEGVQVALGAVWEGVEFLVATNQADEGVIRFAATQLAPASGFEGTGSIIEVTWRGKATGQSDLLINQADLANPDALPISAAIQNGHIQVGTVVVIQGQVNLQGSDDHSGATVIVGERQMQTGAEGDFQVEITPDHSYSMRISAPGHLSVQLEGGPAGGGTTIELGQIMLLGGDVTGDDQVNIFDLAFVGTHFGENEPTADLNGDEIVNIFDLSMAAANYGQAGPIIIGVEPGSAE